MKKHGIGWLNVPGYRPETWNPIVGCSKISDGCRNCYAERMAKRLVSMGVSGYGRVVGPTCDREDGKWNGKTHLLFDALEKPTHWKKPRAIFVNSMGDLFHENTESDWIFRVFSVIEECPQHLFIILTKRAERMQSWVQYSYVDRYGPIPENVWLGVTVENQRNEGERLFQLMNTPAAVRFVSMEPLLEKVVIQDPFLCHDENCGHARGLDWVICGGESGPGARPMHPYWVRSLRDQCQTDGVPFFFKQWGDPKPYLKEQLDAGYTCSKARGGDVLDGRQWHEWPRCGDE